MLGLQSTAEPLWPIQERMMIKKQYEWRELANNGLLEAVRKGTNYCGWDVEIGGPWDTEEEAIAALDRFKSEHEPIFNFGAKLVLLTIYSA